jgi:RNA-directed DNA polymerase
MGGKGEMRKAPICWQDLRWSLYVKAKADPTWRFWGLYVHVCKMETLYEAYRMAKETAGLQELMGSRSRPLRKAEWRVF